LGLSATRAEPVRKKLMIKASKYGSCILQRPFLVHSFDVCCREQGQGQIAATYTATSWLGRRCARKSPLSPGDSSYAIFLDSTRC